MAASRNLKGSLGNRQAQESSQQSGPRPKPHLRSGGGGGGGEMWLCHLTLDVPKGILATVQPGLTPHLSPWAQGTQVAAPCIEMSYSLCLLLVSLGPGSTPDQDGCLPAPTDHAASSFDS